MQLRLIALAPTLAGLLALSSRAAAQSSLDAEASPVPAETAPTADESTEPPAMGVVLVDPDLRAVIVDGAYQRVSDGTVTVTCGKHRILQRDDLLLNAREPRQRRENDAALRKARTVDVPCGGNVALVRTGKSGFALRAHGGLAQRALFKSSVVGVELAMGVGLHVRDIVDVYVLDLQLLFASTRAGLPVREVRVGSSLDFEPFTRVHLGAGVSLGVIGIDRATNGHTLSSGLCAGGRLFASVDVLRTGDRAGLYVLGQLSLDALGGVPETSIWGPTAAIGARF